jgi:DNA-binding GntR family transcriptional regulator
MVNTMNLQARGERQTVAGMLVDELRERILNLDFPEGGPLRQDSLAGEFGVSRIPLREALLQLEGEGLVTQTAHKGYAVSVLSLDEIREVFDLRALIEVDVLQRALPHITSETIAAARDVLARFDDALARQAEDANWGHFNWQLHAALYMPAGRLRSMDILRKLHRNADRYLRLQLNISDHNNARAREEHGRLINLCERRDNAEASRLLREHILAARDDLLEFLAARRSES